MGDDRQPVVRVEAEPNGLTVLTLDSPPLNLFDRAMIDDLGVAIRALAEEPPRAVLINADGRAVSAGVDVHMFDGLTPETGAALWTELLKLIDAIEELPAPVVFAAHALTLTAAFELALACDLIVATPGARFGLVEKVVGLTPSMGGTQRLAERAGSGRARQFVMRGDLFDAVELERWGVVNEIYPEEEFAALSRALADELAAGPTKAHAMTKRILRRFREGGIPAADEAVRTEAAELFASEDLQNAVRTFLEHGGPGHAEFNGR
ncbi:MAG: 2-(1,2-epoxy,2-dihydrophenyl)acetyl-CoA isomerase [Solirubrobacterales bacterium]|nr:2-(1,2-epoxy,2-dihydrophenyl)acetyl-CoA isomerase [Solirubrobacterales bacterium]